MEAPRRLVSRFLGRRAPHLKCQRIAETQYRDG
jgi:hypothetical protein